MEELEENKNLIKMAYLNTQKRIGTSPLNDNEKNAMNLLIDKLIKYYEKKLGSIMRSNPNLNSERSMELRVFMTDMLVNINDVLDGGIDVYYFVSVINRRLNDKEIEKLVKKK